MDPTVQRPRMLGIRPNEPEMPAHRAGFFVRPFDSPSIAASSRIISPRSSVGDEPPLMVNGTRRMMIDLIEC